MSVALTLTQRLVNWLNGNEYSPGHPIPEEQYRDELQLGELLDVVASLGGTTVGLGSDLIGVYDSGSVFTGSTLTQVLAELYTAATTAGSDTFTDTGAFYALDQVGAAFVALGTALGGTSSTVRNYTGGTGTRLIDNDSYFTALDKLDQGFVDLKAVTAAKGASLVGLQDAATFYAATELEAALLELAIAIGGTNSTTRDYSSNTAIADDDTLVVAAGKLDARVGAYQDQLVTATLAVPNSASGATDVLATMQLKRAYDNATNPATICQVLIISTPVQYERNPAGVATVTFSAATTGTIVASGNGWALVTTDATGAFACTISDSADETVYFKAVTPEGISDLGQRCTVVASNSDAAQWIP